MFTAVSARSNADEVFDQVANEIVGGSLSDGSTLPGERELAAQFAVSRSVIREALQRLSQAGLIEIRQGGSTKVRGYEQSSDLRLLNRLIVTDSTINVPVIRSILQARITIGADAARLCATNSDAEVVAGLSSIVDQMSHTEDLVQRQRLDLQFWEFVVIGSENIVYRLAYNGLADTYLPVIDLITAVVEPEIANLKSHERLIKAIQDGDSGKAQRYALAVLESSNAQWEQLLALIEAENQS